MRPEDTSPEAWRILVGLYRRMSPQQKLERTFELSDFVRSFCEAGIRSQYPHASEREVFLRLTQRTLGHDLFQKVYGDVIPQE
jgi:hypothetical protein